MCRLRAAPPGARWSLALLLVGCSASRRGTSSAGRPSAGADRPVVVGDLAARVRRGRGGPGPDRDHVDELPQLRRAGRRGDDADDARVRGDLPGHRRVPAPRRSRSGEREIAAEVVASAVVRATDRQVQALVFLDSFVSEQRRRAGAPARTGPS